MRESLPRDWRGGADRDAAAAALLFALVLDGAPAIRAAQLQKIHAFMGEALEGLVEEQILRAQRLAPEQRLPVLAGIVPALRRLPKETRQRILDCLGALSRVDGEIQIFEYTLTALARLYINESLAPRRLARPVKLRDTVAELQSVFSALAAHGHDSETTRERAYADGIARLRLERPPPFRLVAGWAQALEHALGCLDGLPPPEKALVIEGLAATVVHDGQVTIAEGELLRAICATLHCPLPPLL